MTIEFQPKISPAERARVLLEQIRAANTEFEAEATAKIQQIESEFAACEAEQGQMPKDMEGEVSDLTKALEQDLKEIETQLNAVETETGK